MSAHTYIYRSVSHPCNGAIHVCIAYMGKQQVKSSRLLIIATSPRQVTFIYCIRVRENCTYTGAHILTGGKRNKTYIYKNKCYTVIHVWWHGCLYYQNNFFCWWESIIYDIFINICYTHATSFWSVWACVWMVCMWVSMGGCGWTLRACISCWEIQLGSRVSNFHMTSMIYIFIL